MEPLYRTRFALVMLGVITASLLLLSGGKPAYSSTCGLPNGPKTGTMIVDMNEYKSCGTMPGLTPPGYFWAQLSNMPSGSQLTNGIYGGYCVDLTGNILDNPMFGSIVYTVDFWSSLDPNLPNAVKQVTDKQTNITYSIPWDKINYLLNSYPNASWLNIQAAFWDLVHGCTQAPGSLYTCGTLRVDPFPYGPSAPYGCPSSNPPVVDESLVQSMVADANSNGSGFVPKAGEKIANVGQINNCTPATTCNQYLPYQVILVPGTCPTCTGIVGDFVWKDLDNDGVQDDGEPGIPNVEVRLSGTDAYGQPINLTTTTDQNGKYQFSQLCTGEYRVTINSATLPDDVIHTSPRSSNGNDSNPLDSNEPSGTSVTISTDSSSNLTVDFGYIPLCSGSIGDFVWKDLNGNGTQDDGAGSGLSGAKVLLSGTSVYGLPVSMAAVTDGLGAYSFQGLCQGDYNITVDATTVPAGFVPTSPASPSGDDLVNTDSNRPSGTSVHLSSDTDTNPTVDFGYVPNCSGSIGDYAWKDLNENGVQDAGEPAIQGLTVSLSGTNVYGQLISMTATTDAAGLYDFTGICKGQYSVTVNPATVPAGWVPTSPLSADGNDSILNDSNNPAGTVVNQSSDSESNTSVDFGYIPNCTGLIGDLVWDDLNQNGTQDDGAGSGIDNVQVLLTGINVYGQPVNLSDMTKNGGKYQFADLCKGNYTVAVNTAPLLVSGFVATSPRSANGDDLATNDSNEPIGTAVTLSSDSVSNQTVDFGFYKPCTGTIGDFVWNDLNQNGVQDAGEAGIAGVAVALAGTNVYGTAVNQSVTTLAGGAYQFTGLCQGAYTVNAATPAGFISTLTGKGTAATDNNGSPAAVNLPNNNASDLTIDFGFYKPCSGTIGDFVWNDLNQNGVQDAGEAGIAGVVVTLAGTNVYGVAVNQTFTTLANGLYQFTGLCQGTYAVTAPTPMGYTPTLAGQGTTATDNNGSPATVVLATDAASDQSIDFGFFKACVACKDGVSYMTLKLDWRVSTGDPNERIRVRADSLGGQVLYDSWNDNIPGDGLAVGSTFSFDVPLSAKQVVVTVQGLNHVNETLKATFSAECDLINGQISGNTYIKFKVTDFKLDGDLACTPKYAKIGDYVWKDLNGNAVQDVIEPGMAGVKVELYNCDTGALVATTITDVNGYYFFSNLAAGNYKVKFYSPTGYGFTLKNQGVGSLDSDADPVTGVTGCFFVAAGETNLTIDAGLIKKAIGCTYTIGYWKNHAGFGPQADVVTPLLPQYLGTVGGSKTLKVTTAKIAFDVLGQNVYGTSSNGITKLYAQLLAAKLNIKAGADSSSVSAIITAADSFLAAKSYSSWSTLSNSDKNKVLSWQADLDSYNNGVSGPGHCESQEDVPCIDIIKKISVDGGKTWLDADTEATAAVRTSSGTVQYKLIANNCGLINLANIEIADPALGIGNYIIPALAAGASATLTSSQIPKLTVSNQCKVSGIFENVATASASYNGTTVAASDSAWLNCKTTSACIDILKDVSVDGGATWKTADTQSTAPTAVAPHSADYRITVKNCGTAALSGVVINDPYIGIDGYSVGTLSAGVSKVFTYKQISPLRDADACTTAGAFSNTATASGVYGGMTLADSDIAWLVCTSKSSGGCSYTLGYWKTHTSYNGQKKRNSTWDKSGGENKMFFSTGQSWYEVLMTSPVNGNAYYILAHQYIAAYLNKLSGADTSVIDSQLLHAAELLSKYDGSLMKMADIIGDIKDDFISTVSILDQYNNGNIGPGHCK